MKQPTNKIKTCMSTDTQEVTVTLIDRIYTFLRIKYTIYTDEQ